jgi:hypothetical protein
MKFVPAFSMLEKDGELGGLLVEDLLDIESTHDTSFSHKGKLPRPLRTSDDLFSPLHLSKMQLYLILEKSDQMIEVTASREPSTRALASGTVLVKNTLSIVKKPYSGIHPLA